MNDVHSQTNGLVQLTIDGNTLVAAEMLSSATPVSALNGGQGLGANPTLALSLGDGSTVSVNLSGVTTMQDVVNRIESASGYKVNVTFDTTQNSLTLQQNLIPEFTVRAINGSMAAGDLGIDAVDSNRTGTISGQRLDGDTLEKHAYIKNASFQIQVSGTASGITGSATLGSVAVTMTNGSGQIGVQGSLTLQDPGTDANDGRIDLAELATAVQRAQQDSSALSTLVASAPITGTASASLPVQLSTSLPGFSLPAGAQVTVAWPDITDASSFSVTFPSASTTQSLSISQVMTGLSKTLDSLEQMESAAPFWDSAQPLPVLNQSLSQLINPSATLDAAVETLQQYTPATIDQLLNQLGTLLGTPVTASFSGNIFHLKLSYPLQAVQTTILGLNLPGLGRLVDTIGSAPLSIALSGSVTLDLAIDTTDLDQGFYLQDDSNMTIGVLVNAGNMDFNAPVGPLSVLIRGGTAILDNGTQDQPAIWTVNLAQDSPDQRWSLDDLSNHIQASVTGQVRAVLPVFYPTVGHYLDSSTPNVDYRVADLANASQSTTVVVPNFQAAESRISMSSALDQVVEGWNGVMSMLQNVLSQQVAGQNIPLVGDQMPHTLDFLQQIDKNVVTDLEKAPIVAPGHPACLVRCAGAGGP